MTATLVFAGHSLFPFGRVIVTQAAGGAIAPLDIATGLARHDRMDWGDASAKERAQNEQALAEGNGLHSVYHDQNGVEFWVITEGDRSATTVLLRADY